MGAGVFKGRFNSGPCLNAAARTMKRGKHSASATTLASVLAGMAERHQRIT